MATIFTLLNIYISSYLTLIRTKTHVYVFSYLYRGGKGGTGEVADGNGNAGDGCEAEVIEGVEIGDGCSERRVSIYDWVLRLCRRCDVRIHLSSSSHSFRLLLFQIR